VVVGGESRVQLLNEMPRGGQRLDSRTVLMDPASDPNSAQSREKAESKKRAAAEAMGQRKKPHQQGTDKVVVGQLSTMKANLSTELAKLDSELARRKNGISAEGPVARQEPTPQYVSQKPDSAARAAEGQAVAQAQAIADARLESSPAVEPLPADDSAPLAEASMLGQAQAASVERVGASADEAARSQSDKTARVEASGEAQAEKNARIDAAARALGRTAARAKARGQAVATQPPRVTSVAEAAARALGRRALTAAAARPAGRPPLTDNSPEVAQAERNAASDQARVRAAQKAAGPPPPDDAAVKMLETRRAEITQRLEHVDTALQKVSQEMLERLNGVMSGAINETEAQAGALTTAAVGMSRAMGGVGADTMLSAGTGGGAATTPSAPVQAGAIPPMPAAPPAMPGLTPNYTAAARPAVPSGGISGLVFNSFA